MRDGPDAMSADLRILVVDDEPLALDDLARQLREQLRVSEVMTASSGTGALQVLARQHFDAVFVDVRMPEIDGVELARVVRRFDSPPALIFVSAYKSAAVEAFELRAADYLMKPVSRRRLAEALARVASRTLPPGPPPPEQSRPGSGDEVIAVDIPRGGGVRLLPRSAILYAQSYGDYQRVVSTEGRFLVRARMACLERRWAAHDFVRVHRQFLVNLRQAVAFRRQGSGAGSVAFADGSEVPVARRHVPELRRRLRR